MKLIFSISFFIFSLLYSQDGHFSLIVKQPFNAALFDITEDYDRTLSAVGFSQKFDTKSSTKSFTNPFDYLENFSNANGSQITLIKVGDSAEIILSKRVTLSQFNEAVAVVKTPENGYIIGGHTLGGELLIMKLDRAANIIYTQTFAKANYSKMKNLIALGDGGVLVIGTSATDHSNSHKLFEAGLGNNDIYLARFSKHGEKLWSKKYGTQGDDEGMDAQEAHDGSLIVVGKTTNNTQTEITLLRLSKNGDTIWMKHKKSKGTPLPTKMIQLKERTFLISIIEYDTAQEERIRLLKFNIFGKTLADKEISTRYTSGLYDIKEFSNGTLIGVGYVRDNANQDGLAMQISANLTLLNQEHYGDSNYDSFYAAHILHNSKVGVAGLHTDKNSHESNMWVVKLNPNGTMFKHNSKK